MGRAAAWTPSQMTDEIMDEIRSIHRTILVVHGPGCLGGSERQALERAERLGTTRAGVHKGTAMTPGTAPHDAASALREVVEAMMAERPAVTKRRGCAAAWKVRR